MMVFVRSGTAERAKLKNMSLTELRRGPLQTALNDEESASWLQILENKMLVRHSQPQLFDPEVRHPLDHQPVLIGIMQMVQLHIGIGLEENVCPVFGPCHVLSRFVRFRAGPCDRDEKRLRKPWDAQSCPEMRERSI